MRLAIKYPFLVLLGLFCAEAAMVRQAFAGVDPVVIPDSSGSGLGDTFSSPSSTRRARVTCENNGVTNALRNIRQSESVDSVGNRTLSLSPSQFETIQSSLSGAQLDALSQQIADETGINVEISRADLSSSEVQDAVSSANELVNALDSQQLAAAADSPTFMTLLQLIEGGNESMSGLDSLGGECETGLLKVGLAPAPVPVEVPVEPAPPSPIRNQEPVPEPEPEPVPTFQEPIRGLW